MGHSDGIAAVVKLGTEQWPQVSLSVSALQRHVESRGIGPESLIARPEDIFLAAACEIQDPAAMREFDRLYLSRIGSFIARVSKDPDVVDEVAQQLRIRMLSGTDPRIGHYRGEGPLEGWVRVAAMRTVLNIVESQRSHQHVPVNENQLGDALSPYLAADHFAQGAQLRPAVQKALTAALEEQSSRNKAILRLHFVEHLNIEEIGLLYRVHRATVARWLVSIRREVFSRVQEHLELQFKVTPSEFISLFSAVRSDLHASLSRILGETPDKSEKFAKIT